MAGPTVETIRQEVVDVIFSELEKRNPGATVVRILRVRRGFLGGDLIVVGFNEPAHGDVINYALVRNKTFELFRNDTQLIEEVQASGSRKSFVEVLLSQNAITGLIAVSLLSAIIVFLWREPVNARVPEILSSSLALVLGFYFGKSSGP